VSPSPLQQKTVEEEFCICLKTKEIKYDLQRRMWVSL
jgi:hypothetical protein